MRDRGRADVVVLLRLRVPVRAMPSDEAPLLESPESVVTVVELLLFTDLGNVELRESNGMGARIRLKMGDMICTTTLRSDVVTHSLSESLPSILMMCHAPSRSSKTALTA